MIAIRPTTDFETVRRLGVAAGLEPGVAPGLEALAGWTAVEDGRTVGGVLLERLAARTLVGWLWVDAGGRRRGLGGRLVETAVDEARRRGADAVWAVARVPAVFLRHEFVPVPDGPDRDRLLATCRECGRFGGECRPEPVVRRLA